MKQSKDSPIEDVLDSSGIIEMEKNTQINHNTDYDKIDSIREDESWGNQRVVAFNKQYLRAVSGHV